MKKVILSVRSNPYYGQQDSERFILQPVLELVIIHSDGKNYEIQEDGSIISKIKLAETRLIVGPETLESLIEQLTNHQQKMKGIEKNAEQINKLVTLLDKEQNRL
jgi:transcriptional regulator NrdR family protein